MLCAVVAGWLSQAQTPVFLAEAQLSFHEESESNAEAGVLVVQPQEAFERYGADSLRLYMLFSGPPEAPFDWPEEGVTAIGRRDAACDQGSAIPLRSAQSNGYRA